MRVVLIGPPGAGKGTQARALASLWGIPQVSSGDLLRAVVREDSDLGREAASYMDRGQLVPDELVLKLIAERLRKKDADDGGWRNPKTPNNRACWAVSQGDGASPS